MEYKGEIAGFPQEVVEKMLERQVEQGNKIDVTVFEEDKLCISRAFYWKDSVEGHNFWHEVITERNFDVFFEKYPKKQSEYPRVMLVSQNNMYFDKRVVFMEKNGKYLAWESVETLEEAENSTNVATWSYAKDIEPEPIELTIDEIAEKFGIKPEQVKIKK